MNCPDCSRKGMEFIGQREEVCSKVLPKLGRYEAASDENGESPKANQKSKGGV